MTTRKILTLTLLATTLTLGAAVPREFNQTTKEQRKSISSQIAATLSKRGIEEKKAQEFVQEMLKSTDQEVFTFMVQTFSNESSININAIYEELGKRALQKKNVDFSSYSFLVSLTHSIKKTILSSKELSALEEISTKNTLISNTFS